MDLNVQITRQGMIVTWPGGQIMLANIDRVHLATPHTAITLNADGTNWPEQTPDGPSENPFDPMYPDADLADCIVHFLTQPQAVLPASLNEIQNQLRSRTVFDARMVGHPNLERTMGSDLRFRKLPGNDWTLTVAPPPSDHSHPAIIADARRPPPKPPRSTAIELFHKEFNPRTPAGKVTDYVYYLMTQPDQTPPIPMARILEWLTSHTAVNMSRETTPRIRRQLIDDPRFQKVDAQQWDLSLADLQGDLKLKSTIDYIVELVEQAHVKLPISLSILAKLVERHTDIGRPRCGPDTLQAAMIRDPRFYRIAPEIWQVKLTPREPEDTPTENP